MIFSGDGKIYRLPLIAVAVHLLVACSTNNAKDVAETLLSPPKKDKSYGSTVAVGSATTPPHSTASISQMGSGSFIGPQSPAPAAVAEAQLSGETVTLNLAGASIPNAAKVVLGDILRLNYTVADKLAGNITIQSASPMPRSALIEVFEHALKMNGAALIQGDGHYQIVPAADVGQVQLSYSSRIHRDRPGLQLLVVPLRFASAHELRNVLEPAVPKGAVVKADDTRSLLILEGTATDLAVATDLVKLLDVDWMRGMSVAMLPINSADPEATVKEVEPLLGIDRDGPQQGTIRLIPHRRLSAIMILSTKPHLVERARAYIQKLDKIAVNTEEQVFVHKVRNRNATELSQLLSRLMATADSGGTANITGNLAPRVETATLTGGTTGGGSGFGSTGLGQGTSGSSQSGTGSSGTSTLGSGSSTLGSGSSSFGSAAKGLSDSSMSGSSNGTNTSTGGPTTFGSGATGDSSLARSSAPNTPRGIKIIADENNHTLLITATRRDYERIQRILDRIDVPPVQVMLEAMIAEVTLTDNLKFGVKWAFGKNTHATLSDVASGAIASSFPGFSYFFSTSNGSIKSVVDALSTLTKVNVVSAPSLMVADNRKAQLQIGDEVPIVTQQAQSVQNALPGTLNPIINSVTLKDTGVILNVTPSVGEQGRVTLDIEQEVSSATKTVTSGIDSPTISQRRIRTTVVVSDGDVITLGGLIQEKDTKTKNQVPVLGNIPILGTAFRQTDDNAARTELLIFIRPLIVANREDALSVTDEFRRRLSIERPTTSIGRNEYDRDLRRILH